MTAPTRAHLRELTELGVFLDTVYEGLDFDDETDVDYCLRGNPGQRLLWSPGGRALVVLGGYKLPPPKKTDDLPAKPARVYETWTRGREASQVRELELELPAGKWQDVGPALRIGYRSDKFHHRGETVDYQHEFENGVRLYRLGSGAKSVLAWRGGRLRITEHGIEG